MSSSPPKEFSIDGSSISIGIVAARYNEELVDALLSDVENELKAAGVRQEGLEVIRVPGSNEVPLAVSYQVLSGKFDTCIALGVIVRGGTPHYELIARSSCDALQQIAIDSGVPVINGIIVAENESQAVERCKGEMSKSSEFAQAALEMAAFVKNYQES
ncbi:MAG: 6,7-dimethyl-8-ribityllumazine synthase [Opitutaceae bacterium]|nr:6,7-dimethyl-8-ribityllumazine synthase [Opitutaceae bacterium]